MSSPLPPDPYAALGVAKDAEISAIRIAHRRLVLKLHPDRIKDEAEKLKGRDEFQKVQKAYEILSDPERRSRYDDQIKLAHLRREAMMQRGSLATSATSPMRPAPTMIYNIRRETGPDRMMYEERTPATFFESKSIFNRRHRYEEEPSRTSARKPKNSQRYQIVKSVEGDARVKEKSESSKRGTGVAGITPRAAISPEKKAEQAKRRVQEKKDKEREREREKNISEATSRGWAQMRERSKTQRHEYYQSTSETAPDTETYVTAETTRPVIRPARPSASSRSRREEPKRPSRPRRYTAGMDDDEYDEKWGRQQESVLEYMQQSQRRPEMRRASFNYWQDTDRSRMSGTERDRVKKSERPKRSNHDRPGTDPVDRGRSNDGLYTTNSYNGNRHRASSVRSNVSSANASLRGGRRFERDYQNAEFSRGRSGSAGSYEIEPTSPGLPPPPKRQNWDWITPRLSIARPDISNQLENSPSVSLSSACISLLHAATATDNAAGNHGATEHMAELSAANQSAAHDKIRQCYICGDTVDVRRKLDWQEHVLQDLRPYQCFEEQCPDHDTTYITYKSLLQHYQTLHPTSAILGATPGSCIFCGDVLQMKVEDRFKHIGAHLREVAFAVVPRQYEEWEFYSELGSQRQAINALRQPLGEEGVPEGEGSVLEILPPFSRKHDNENLDDALQDLHGRIEDWKSMQTDNLGELLLFGVYNVKKEGNIRSDGKEFHIYLFSRVLVMCKEVSTAKEKNQRPTMHLGGRPRLNLKARIFFFDMTQITPTPSSLNYKLEISYKGAQLAVEQFVITFKSKKTMWKWHNVIEAQRSSCMLEVQHMGTSGEPHHWELVPSLSAVSRQSVGTRRDGSSAEELRPQRSQDAHVPEPKRRAPPSREQRRAALDKPASERPEWPQPRKDPKLKRRESLTRPQVSQANSVTGNPLGTERATTPSSSQKSRAEKSMPASHSYPGRQKAVGERSCIVVEGTTTPQDRISAVAGKAFQLAPHRTNTSRKMPLASKGAMIAKSPEVTRCQNCKAPGAACDIAKAGSPCTRCRSRKLKCRRTTERVLGPKESCPSVPDSIVKTAQTAQIALSELTRPQETKVGARAAQTRTNLPARRAQGQAIASGHDPTGPRHSAPVPTRVGTAHVPLEKESS